MKKMEEDINRHRHGNFLRRMRKLTKSRVMPTNTILVRSARPSKTLRQRHFAEALCRGTQCSKESS